MDFILSMDGQVPSIVKEGTIMICPNHNDGSFPSIWKSQSMLQYDVAFFDPWPIIREMMKTWRVCLFPVWLSMFPSWRYIRCVGGI